MKTRYENSPHGPHPYQFKTLIFKHLIIYLFNIFMLVYAERIEAGQNTGSINICTPLNFQREI